MHTAREGRAVRLWLTTADRALLLSEQQPLFCAPSQDGASVAVEIRDRAAGQPMDGFGAALTDSSAWILHRLPEARREMLLQELFHPGSGLGFSVIRLPIGASDFAVRGSYTYDDMPPGGRDPDLTHFSIAHDRAYILPLLRRIRQINPALKIIASPWSAPAWMKTSHSVNGGWLDWPAYAAYARYFVRFLQAYAAEGVPIHAITVQNEPRNENASYPTMRMEPRDQARFVRDHLGPALAAAGLKTKILIWDHNWDAPSYPLEVLSDAAARRYIAGVAWHAYAGDPSAQGKVQRAWPQMEMHFTESSGGDWSRDFGANLRWDIEHLIAGATRYGARSVLKWNLALDERHGPTNGGCMNCTGVVTIDSRTGAVTRNSEYYALGHASRFVRPGARWVESNASGAALATAAFRNPNGARVVVIGNLSTRRQTVAVRWQSMRGEVAFGLPASAVATLVAA